VKKGVETSHMGDIWKTSTAKQRILDRISVVTNNPKNKETVASGA
jgi:hypothetical protein